MGVLLISGALPKPVGQAAVKPKPRVIAKKSWLADRSGVMLPKKLTGEYCQPPRASLTMAVDTVDRNEKDAVVRNEVWSP